MAVGAVVARILTQYSDKGSKQAQKDIAKLGKRIDDFGKQALKSFGIVAAASAAMAVKIGKDAVRAAIDENKSTAVLTNTLRNYGLATQENIDIINQYIDKQEMLSLVSDTELRASFGRLIAVSGDVTKSITVQTAALDVAAGTTVDFNTVSKAFEKAVGGNFTALKKILPGIDENIIKNKDLGKTLEYATAIYGGSAEAFGDTDPLKKLSIAYGRVLETLGGALLPVVISFTEYLTGPGGLIESLQEWVKVNEEELQKSLEGVSDLFKLILENSGNLTKALDVLVAVSGLLNTSILGIIKVGEVFFLGGIALGIALKLKKVFGGLSFEALLTGKRFDVVSKKAQESATKAGKLGAGFKTTETTKDIGIVRKAINTLGKRAKIVTGIIAGIGAGFAIVKTLFGPSDSELLKQMQEQTKKDFELAQKKAEKERLAAIRAANAAKIAKAAQEAAAKAARAAAADAAKQAAEKALILKYEKELAKFGVKATSEQDPIQLAAAAKLLEKQGLVAKAEKEKLERIMEENLLLKARETLALRYQDIQKALADQKLDTKELEDLSKKWGISIESVAAYIHIVKSVEDQVISTDEIQALADLWNTSTDNAHKFLETYMRIQDGLLSSNEVFDLIKMGFFKTEEEARKYADYVAVVHDGLVDDEEFEKLRIKWNDRVQDVVNYFNSMGVKFDYNGQLIDPVDRLATSWTNAGDALQRFLDLLNGAKGFDYNKFSPPSGVPGGTPPIVTPKTPDPILGGSRTDSAASAAERAAASAQAAVEYALAKARKDDEAARLAAARVNPSALASQESGAIGAASIAAQLAKAENDVRIAATYAQFKAKEAEDLAASQATAAQMDYDERFRFKSMTLANASTFDPARFRASESGNTINVTVQGSVTSEQDLVQTIRNGLLSQQYNGDSITLQAV